MSLFKKLYVHSFLCFVAQLMMVLDMIKTEIHKEITSGKKGNESLSSKLDRMMKSHLSKSIFSPQPVHEWGLLV